MKRVTIHVKSLTFVLLCVFISIGYKEVSAQSRRAASHQSVIKVGDKAPDILQYDTSGKPVRLLDFRGKYVLLDFWGSSCGPCRKSHPHLIEVYNRYKVKNFTIVSVSVYDMPWHKDLWLEAIKKDGLTWTQVAGPPNNASAEEIAGMKKKSKSAGYGASYVPNTAAKSYGIQALPRNFLIDPTGQVIGMDLKGAALDAALAKILGS